MNNNTNVRAYDINATLDHIDYGQRAGSEGAGTVPAQVWFTRTGRCINTCQQNTNDYPDTPWDLYCSSSTSCPNVVSPAFWTEYKLSNVQTWVWNAATSSYKQVDQWDLGYLYPSTGDYISPVGDDTSPNLWLQTLTHTGYALDGSTLAEPTMNFGGTAMANRVDWGNDVGVPPYMHYRLTSVLTGVGGQTWVTYSNSECARAWTPVPDSNPYRCFPEYLTGWGWFNKYVTTAVTDMDLTGGSPDEVWSYTYSSGGTSDPGLWHHDYAETSLLANRSWSLWRGYPSVTVTHGTAGGPQTQTTSLYYRGQDGDGKNSTDGQSVSWGARRAGVLTPLSIGTPGLTSAIAGGGGRCLDINGANPANGTNVDLWDCTGAWNEVWQTVSNGAGSYQIKNPQSGRCLDVYGAGTANGTNVDLYDCVPGATNELWQRQPDGSWRGVGSGRCLDQVGAGAGNGTNVDIWDCTGVWNEVWQLQNSGAIVAAQAHRCADVTGGATSNGTKIETWNCASSANQQWQSQTNGSLKNPVSGRCLDIVGAALSTAPKSSCTTAPAPGTKSGNPNPTAP